MTAFSPLSSPPSLLVGGILQTLATHQIGNNTKPMKNAHACIGDPISPSLRLGKRNLHSVGCLGGGLCGSRMWNLEVCVREGACGEMSALMGMDMPETEDRPVPGLLYVG